MGRNEGMFTVREKSIKSLETRHNVRLKESVNISGEVEIGMIKISSSDDSDRKYHTSSTIKITELKHKLKYTLDNDRQCEAIRASRVKVTNKAFQSKLDELKTKNTALVAKKVEGRVILVEASRFSSLPSLNKLSHRESSVRDKDLHKMKKQLTAAVINKIKPRQSKRELRKNVTL